MKLSPGEPPIRNLIFDFGGVLLNLDFDATPRAFEKLLGRHAPAILEKCRRDQVFEKLETGDISEAEFFAVFQNARLFPEDAIAAAWNAMLLDLPPHRLDFLEKLRRRYRVFLLSNTNSIHLRQVFSDIQTRLGITDFSTRFFEKAWYSHLLRLRKPDTAIYQFVLADAGLLAAETLFIDDLPPNIEGAKKAGLRTLLHDPTFDITEVLRI